MLPEWFEERPAHLPGQLGWPHIAWHRRSEYAGSRQPLFTVPCQPFARAQSRYGLSQAATGLLSNFATPARRAAVRGKIESTIRDQLTRVLRS